MKKYLCEPHLHTCEVSPCGVLSAKEQINLHIEAGCSTIIVTDHFSRNVFDASKKDWSWDKKIDYFLNGYRIAKAEAKGRINVILGMELCFNGGCSDFLVYGVTEEFLRKYNNDEMNFLDMSIDDFINIAHENGLLVYQAHPFRNRMTVTVPYILDGIEVYNANPRHDSRNDIALIWAEKFNLNRISGSDVHQIEDIGGAGIYTDEEITSGEQFLKILKSGNYELKMGAE